MYVLALAGAGWAVGSPPLRRCDLILCSPDSRTYALPLAWVSAAVPL